ncbi:cAMP-regulated phosphoprotein 21 isoform X13 [Delphinapterus leucas]|uniref:cAMP-regulated phosphoprotein 21 isoform X13 n=1 Tax=Delphinapterus leucas TaxID=9749 RepID=A0A2Y9LLL5_DELLE|nr:cAMP-regulated phosphoprotein 21 isoform X13 [Delphinapterus leucas]
MSEPGDLSQTIVEEGGPEQETATPENGVVKSESLDEEEKLELQRQLAAQNQERRKSKSGAGKGKLTRSLAVCEESSARPGGESLQDQESIHLQLSSFPSLQEDDKSRKDDSEREKEKDKNKDKTCEKPKIRMLSKVIIIKSFLRCRPIRGCLSIEWPLTLGWITTWIKQGNLSSSTKPATQEFSLLPGKPFCGKQGQQRQLGENIWKSAEQLGE